MNSKSHIQCALVSILNNKTPISPCPIVTRGRGVSNVGKRSYNAELRCKTTPEVGNFIKVIEKLKCFLTRIGARCAHIILKCIHVFGSIHSVAVSPIIRENHDILCGKYDTRAKK